MGGIGDCWEFGTGREWYDGNSVAKKKTGNQKN